MGGITSNRKRSEECLSVNHAYSSPKSSDFRRPKRLKFSSMPHNPIKSPLSSNSTASRISRYPEVDKRSVRAPLAPCSREYPLSSSNRDFKCRTSGISEEIGHSMGNILNRYSKAKNNALGSIRYVGRGKEVIEVDTDGQKDAVSEDSSIEVIEIIEDGREGRSVVTNQGRQRTSGLVIEIQDSETKVVDGGLQQQSTSSVVSELTNSNLKVDNDVKIVESLSPERDITDILAYKKLLQYTDRRTDKINWLKFEIELNERRLRLRPESLRPEKEPEQELPLELFSPLTEEEENEVERAFSANRKKVLVAHENSNIEITGEIFKCLRPGAWLNDEVINLYLELLKEREKREPQKFLKCHFFNTFFYKKLIGGRSSYDFKSVRRWTTQRKLGYSLLECDKVFVPIHKEVHWCLAIINKKDKKFQYLDSLRGIDNQVLKVLARYFIDEVKDKNGKEIDVSSWEKEFVEDLPEQENGFDCGMFMIKYADFYSRGLGLCFNQEHMPYFRRRTAKEILRLKAD